MSINVSLSRMALITLFIGISVYGCDKEQIMPTESRTFSTKISENDLCLFRKEAFFVIGDKEIKAFDFESGKELWHVRDERIVEWNHCSRIKAEINKSGNLVIIVCDAVLAFDINNGELIWSFETSSLYDHVMKSDKIIVCSGSGISVLDSESGKLLNSIDTEAFPASKISVCKQKILLSNSSHLKCFSINGKLLWEKTFGEKLEEWRSCEAIINGRLICLYPDQNTIEARDISSGKIIWKRKEKNCCEEWLFNDKGLFFLGGDTITALAPDSGVIRWIMKNISEPFVEISYIGMKFIHVKRHSELHQIINIQSGYTVLQINSKILHIDVFGEDLRIFRVENERLVCCMYQVDEVLKGAKTTIMSKTDEKDVS